MRRRKRRRQTWWRLVGTQITLDLGGTEQIVDLPVIVEARIVAETDFGHVFHLAQLAAETAADEFRVTVERHDDGIVVGHAKWRHIGGGDLQVGRHAHFRYGDHGLFDQVVAHFAALEDLSNGGANLFANAKHALGGRRRSSLGHFLVLFVERRRGSSRYRRLSVRRGEMTKERPKVKAEGRYSLRSGGSAPSNDH